MLLFTRQQIIRYTGSVYTPVHIKIHGVAMALQRARDPGMIGRGALA